MPTTSTPEVRTKLVPPANSMIRVLKNVAKDRKMKCYAIGSNANHRFQKTYKPWTEDLEPMLSAIRKSKLLFTKENCATLAQIFLCRKHRKDDKHVASLSHTLSTAKGKGKDRISKGCQDDSGFPRDHQTGSDAPCYIQRGSRSNSTEPDPETLSSLPDTDPIKLVDAFGELKCPELLKCIAYDGTKGRCGRTLAEFKQAAARKICDSIPVDGESDDEDEDGDEEYQEDDEEVSSPLSQLRPLIYHLLCSNKHRQWFWLEFYYREWKGDVACASAASGVSELCSDFEMDNTDSSDQESTQEDDPAAQRSLQSSASSFHTASEHPHTPKRPTSELRKKAHTAPGRVPQAKWRRTQDDEITSISPDDPSSPSIRRPSSNQHGSAAMRNRRSTIHHLRTPSISVSKVASSPSPPSTPVTELRRSPRLAARRSPSYKEPSTAFRSEDDLVECLGSLSINGGLHVLTEAWSLKIGNLLYEEVRKPLKGEINTGSLYVVVSTSHPGLVKVGRTIRPGTRGRQIKQDCKLDDLDSIKKFRDVDHHDRVELLAHRHLRRFKEVVPCIHKKGVKDHQEWFRCSPELAIQVVEVWVEWMKMQPYEKDFLREPWKGTVRSLRDGPESSQRETFEQLLQRHKRWLLQ